METILPENQATFVTYTHFTHDTWIPYFAFDDCLFPCYQMQKLHYAGLPMIFLPKVGGSCESARGAKAGVDVTRSL